MSNVGIEVTGFEELKQKIKLLANDKDKRKEVLLILRQVARPTLAAAKVLVPVSKKPHFARGFWHRPGNLKKSLGFIKSKSENPMVLMGPLVSRARGFNGFGNGWYGHFVHDGINIYNKGFKRKHKKGANNQAAKSRIAGNPFMTKAYEQTKSGATADTEKKMAAFIQRRIDKLS
ncbi:hypothetical protein D3C85_615000 [compost metagenome]